jgi:HD-GYP domain-containing protein (c-di-GMP phosphodiesterase class II)
VSGVGFPWDIRPMLRHHHERWDGTGYPDRLAGEQIPRAARILCIADVFDALTSARSYRTAYSVADAITMMNADSGTVFDPHLLQIFLRRTLRPLEYSAEQVA